MSDTNATNNLTLVANIGNSNILLGIYRDTEALHHFRLQSISGQTSDEYHLLISDHLRRWQIEGRQMEQVIVGSVVPPVTTALMRALAQVTQCSPLLVHAGFPLEIGIRPENVSEVGIDLIANATAAYHRNPQGCIVVDFGTALTVTAVSAAGVLEGVAIAPGLQIAAHTLSRETAQLPEIPLLFPPAYLGRNTVQAIQSGIMLGYCGLIEALLSGFQKEMGAPVNVIATGGMAEDMVARIPAIEQLVPLLTLEGLRRIGKQSAS